jgi:hypothetical protein
MGTPPIVGIMAGLILLAILHEVWPDLVPAYLGLALLYLALTHVDRAQALLRAGPAGLARLLTPSPSPGAGPAGGGGRPAQLVSL